MLKFFGTLKFRLTAWYMLIVMALVAFSTVTAYVLLSRGLALKTVYPWDMRSATVEKTADGVSLSGFSEVFQRQSPARGFKSVRGLGTSEILDLASDNRSIEFVTPEGSLRVDASAFIYDGMPENSEIWLYLYGSAEQPGVYQLVQVNQTALAMEARLESFRKTVLITGGLTLALAAVLGFFLVWRFLRPLRAITEAARGMGGHDMTPRVKVSGGGEIGELGSTLNRMFDRVETAVESERQVASDLSHELRTPLAVMQTEATQALRKARGHEAYQKALETVNREVSHVSSVAERLLFLARSEHGRELAMAPVDLKELAEEIGWDAEVLCEAKGIVFQSHLSDLSNPSNSSDSCAVRGDRTRLRELFLNLLNNAVRYTPSGGTISLSLGRQDGYITAAVADTGIGISEKHLPHIFERFYRVDNGGPDDDYGAGLGLAICQRIAELHGGRIEVDSKLGKGSTFTVFLALH